MAGSDQGARAPGRILALRFGLLVGIIALVAILAAFAPQYLSVERLAAQRLALSLWVQAHPLMSLLAYLALYTAVIGFSLPGALVMSLAGGLMFGAVGGTLAAVTGVTSGALMMFAGVRALAGHGPGLWLEQRGGVLLRLKSRLTAHPFTALLTLRLIPAAPVFLVNLAAALARISYRDYLAATVLGVVPSTTVYASTGAGLGRLISRATGGASLADLLRQELTLPVMGLAALALLPTALRWVHGRWFRQGLAQG